MYALYASNAHQPSCCIVSGEAHPADKFFAPPSPKRVPSVLVRLHARQRNHFSQGYRRLLLRPRGPFATTIAIRRQGSRQGQTKNQDINSSIKPTASPPAPTDFGEPARTREITAPNRNWSPLDPRNRTSTRSALGHPNCARPQTNATSARRKQYVSWICDRVSAIISDSRVIKQNAHNTSHNTRPRYDTQGSKFRQQATLSMTRADARPSDYPLRRASAPHL